MKLSIIQQMTFRSKLSAAEVEKRLAQETEPEKIFRATGFLFNGNSLYYEGKIADGQFKVAPISRSKDSFLPVIQGTIEQTMGGTLIHVKMRMHLAFFAFLAFWAFSILTGFILMIFIEDAGSSGGLLLPLIIVSLIYVTFCLFFGERIKPEKKYLAKMWEATVEE